MKKISFVIPVFNTELYLKKCLDSCISQDIEKSEYEIIVIDDGSTDQSLEIIKEYKERYSNIVLILKTNGGVSSARNVGIKAATGEYILFVDSDDTIKGNSLKSILNELTTGKLDLLILNSIAVDNKNNRKYPFPAITGKCVFTGIELYKLKYIRGSVCGVAFNRKFLIENDLSFSEVIKNGEDTFFMACAFLYAQAIGHLNIDFYEISQRTGSASRSWTYLKAKQMLESLNEIEAFIKHKKLSFEQIAVLRITAYGFISTSFYYFFETHEYAKYSEFKSLIKNSELYPVRNYISNQFKSKIYLLNLSIDLFCVPFLFRQIVKDLSKSFQNNNRQIAQIND